MGAGGGRKRERRTGRGPEGDQRFEICEPDRRRIAGRTHQVHDVVGHLGIDVQIGDGVARGENLFRLQQRLHRDRLVATHPLQHLALLVARGIGYPDLEHEAVELGLRKRISAFVLDRVLGGKHQERLVQHEGVAADGDLLLLHRFQQRCLHLGRRAVDFVGQDDVGEERALLDVKVLALLVEHHGADDIGRQQVGRELDPGERRVHHLREGAHRQGLGQAGHALQQDVPAGQQPDEQPLHHLVLPHDHLADFGRDPRAERFRRLLLRHSTPRHSSFGSMPTAL